MVKDCRGAYMGFRTMRYSMFIDNGIVKHIFIDEKGNLNKQSSLLTITVTVYDFEFDIVLFISKGYGNTSADQLLQKL
jgi:hypothetical protein